MFRCCVRFDFNLSIEMERKDSKICCPQHPDAYLLEDYRAGDLICQDCGLVVGDRVIDVGAEWRTFSDEKSLGGDPSRVGGRGNTLLSGEDLSTMVGPGGRGAAAFDSSGNSKYKNQRDLSSSDQAMVSAIKEISGMGDRINVPHSITDRATNLFKQVKDGNNLKSRSRDAITAACLYIACRQEHVPRTFNEICAVSGVRKKEIGRVFKLILKALETTVDLVNTGDFMSRFCANLELPIKVQKAAICIANKAEEFDIVTGKSPVSIAAAAIFMASQASECKKTILEIAEIAGCAEFTIIKTYRLMYPRAFRLFPVDFEFDTSINQLPHM
ncbi:transcription initiation factor IIB-like [Harmonia axyridis]|uniref:transcription initiation factor IIB-like n=1 Tax=Harmonia axyridis TaxID=115357 RepID=UPI001E2792A5|nr:transcription initiation factor IIB-like [Harmonia axyridis]